MLGRAYHFSLAALGPGGADHLTELLKRDMEANMGQLGAADLAALPQPLAHTAGTEFPL